MEFVSIVIASERCDPCSTAPHHRPNAEPAGRRVRGGGAKRSATPHPTPIGLNHYGKWHVTCLRYCCKRDACVPSLRHGEWIIGEEQKGTRGNVTHVAPIVDGSGAAERRVGWM